MWWAHHDVRFVVYRQALVYDNSADNNNVGTEVKGAQPDRLHWSQAKPLSQNQVSNDDVPVNLADGHYDEAAQRAAFQAAVAEWRGSAAVRGGVCAGVHACVAGTDGLPLCVCYCVECVRVCGCVCMWYGCRLASRCQRRLLSTPAACGPTPSPTPHPWRPRQLGWVQVLAARRSMMALMNPPTAVERC